MTKSFLTASTCALVLLASACGSGGGGGGGEGGETPPQPAGPAGEVAACLGKEDIEAKVDKAGAKLVRAKGVRDAVVAKLGKNTTNILFFPSPDAASTVKEKVKNENLVNIERSILVVFSKVPKSEQKQTINDCLPDDKKDQQEDEQKKK
jgi:hypothetical protein